MNKQQESAYRLSQEALIWLANENDLMSVFCGSTGIDPGRIREVASEPEFLAAVLDFILMDDAWVKAFAAAADVRPERVPEARAALPGGAEFHWT